MSALGTALALANRGIASVPIGRPSNARESSFAPAARPTAARRRNIRSPRLGGPTGPKIAPNGVNSATTNSGILKHWFGNLVPRANLGVSTAILIVLDVDPRHGGMESLSAMARDGGEMPSTWSVKTGSGGMHIYYRRPQGLELRLPIIAENIIRAGGTPPFGRGIDIPGYVIAPPSRHICGQHYEWDDHPSDYPLAEAPAWIVDRLTKAERHAANGTATDPAEWAKLTGGAITEYRDVHATKVAGKLLRAVSIDPRFAAGLLHAWNVTYCRPPIPDHELTCIFNRIANREAERLERENEN